MTVGVYFLLDAHNRCVKIGYSTDVRNRVADLSAGNPNQVVLIGLLEAGPEREGLMHRMFEEYHVRGEWYEASPEILDYVSRKCQTRPPEALGKQFADWGAASRERCGLCGRLLHHRESLYAGGLCLVCGVLAEPEPAESAGTDAALFALRRGLATELRDTPVSLAEARDRCGLSRAILRMVLAGERVPGRSACWRLARGLPSLRALVAGFLLSGLGREEELDGETDH